MPSTHPDPSHAAALAVTAYMDHDHPAVTAFVREVVHGLTAPIDQAVALYGAVRDRFRYNPYHIDLSLDGMRASSVLARGEGWCVPKATLLVAACRSLGIPARLGLADVKNHVTTPRLSAMMDTDIFYRHGYALILLEGRWVKATPAFNAALCEKMHILPLAFNGREDSIYHPFDLTGQKHMEYLTDHGAFDDVPIDDMRPVFERYYARLLTYRGGGWEQDVVRSQGS